MRCSLNLSPNVLGDSPMYSTSHSILPHLYLYMTPLFFLDGILAFWSHQEVLYGIASFKVDLHSMFTACFLNAFTDSFIIRNHHMWFLDAVARILGAPAILVGFGFGFDFNPIQCPCRIFASCECLFQVFFLLLQQLRAGTDGLSSVMK